MSSWIVLTLCFEEYADFLTWWLFFLPLKVFLILTLASAETGQLWFGLNELPVILFMLL